MTILTSIVNEQFCLLTSHGYPTGFGGEETFLAQFTEFLQSRKLQYTIISSAKTRSEHVDPVSIREFSVPSLGFEVYSFLFVWLALFKVLKINSHRRVGLLYSVETGYAGLAAVLAGWILRLPTIVHSHTKRGEALRDIRGSKQDWRTWPYWALERFLDRFVTQRATGVIAVSDDVKNYLRSLGVLNEQIMVASSAVDIAKFSAQGGMMEWRSELGPSAFVIGYFGRLEEIKGIGVLLQAYVYFRQKSHRLSYLVLGGEGKDRVKFENQVKQQNIPNTLFVGYQQDAPAFLRSIDIFVLPSFQEGSPIALLEAMAAGCPIVATRIPGVSEIGDEFAILVPPRDSKTLGQALIRLEADRNLRKKLAANAKLRSVDFSTQKIMEEILKFCLSSYAACSLGSGLPSHN